MDNLTAKISCFARAYHFKNHSSHIFADPVAECILGEEYDQVAQSMIQGIGFFLPNFHGNNEEALHLIVDRQLSPSVLGRSAYCERILENEKRIGCRQYIILASGYDTFAIRNSDMSLSIFELDLPEMIADKKMRIEKAGLKANTTYIPCDLSDMAWKDRLLENGFRCEKKTFCSLLGISYYLKKDDFRNLLMTLGSILCDGSAICFDYPSPDDSHETLTNQTLAQGAGEAMKAKYDYKEMESLLGECGFLIYEHLNHIEMTSQYFSNHNKCCPAYNMEASQGVCYVLAVRKDC